MSIAQEIIRLEYFAAIAEAEEKAVEVDQDWKNESTVFEFSDGSRIKFSGPTMEIIRPAREYTVIMRDDSDGDNSETFTIPDGTESDQDKAALKYARELAVDWVNAGDWGDEGARVDVCYVMSDESSEWDARTVTVEIEPDHDALIRRAGGDVDCDHDWTGEGHGGCDENPGVWSVGGTAMVFVRHCTKCGLHMRERATGTQYNPGEHDTVEYWVPERESEQ